MSIELMLLIVAILTGYCVGSTVIQVQRYRRTRRIEAVLRRLNQQIPPARLEFKKDLRQRVLTFPLQQDQGSSSGESSSHPSSPRQP